MSGPHFEQLRTRLKGLGLGRVGMKKLKNSHKGGVVRKFRTREGWCASFAHLKGVCEIFAQGKMVCEIFAYLWFSKTESMQFLKSGAKANSHRVSGVRNFRTPQGGVRILLSLVFSPLFSLVFTKTSFFKPSYLHVNTNRNHIRMKLKSKIEIKTCINTRKH